MTLTGERLAPRWGSRPAACSLCLGVVCRIVSEVGHIFPWPPAPGSRGRAGFPGKAACRSPVHPAFPSPATSTDSLLPSGKIDSCSVSLYHLTRASAVTRK